MTTFVYKSLVSKFEMRFCRKNARTSPVRLANQRHPAVTGAGVERLAMNTETFQVRSLAIEATGDFFRKRIAPKIRLSGQWLERAGFRPGHRVQVIIEQPGSLTLRFLAQGKEVAL